VELAQNWGNLCWPQLVGRSWLAIVVFAKYRNKYLSHVNEQIKPEIEIGSSIVNTIQEILQIATNFYFNLYQAKSTDTGQNLLLFSLP
jgi:hypothetical protein